MDDSRIKNAGSLLSAFFDEEKLQRGGRFAEFFANWRFVVGERLAAHSRIADVDKGVLIVEAEHPGWIQLLQFRQSEILSAVSSRFPELGLRSVVFRLAKGGSGGAAAAATARPGPFGPQGRELNEAELAAEVDRGRPGADEKAPNEGRDEPGPSLPRSLSDIEDPGLRNLLADLKRAVDRGRDAPEDGQDRRG